MEARAAAPRRAVEHRYRTTIGDLRSQWRGYAAGRAWLARRYDGFEPEPAAARALRVAAWRPAAPQARGRAGGRRQREASAVGPAGARRLRAARRGSVGRGARRPALSNRPIADADRLRRGSCWSPTAFRRGEIRWSEFARPLDGARIEAAARPESLEMPAPCARCRSPTARTTASRLARSRCSAPGACAPDAVRRSIASAGRRSSPRLPRSRRPCGGWPARPRVRRRRTRSARRTRGDRRGGSRGSRAGALGRRG